jgi:intracellular septation protein A
MIHRKFTIILIRITAAFLLLIKKNSNKPVLKHVQPHEISFSTSVTERISWVDVCYNITASCNIHVINNSAIKFLPVT